MYVCVRVCVCEVSCMSVCKRERVCVCVNISVCLSIDVNFIHVNTFKLVKFSSIIINQDNLFP